MNKNTKAYVNQILENRHSMEPFCTGLVLNYNGREHLEVCLKSLENQTYNNCEIILVDNASTDDSSEFVKKKFPNIRIIKNSRNAGTAGGFNFGARHVKSKYILFLANDIEAEPNLIEEMIKIIESDPQIAICSAKMLKFDRRDIIDYAGFQLDLYGFPRIIGHLEKDTGRYDIITDTIPTGTCLLIKRKVFEKVGGFDDDYFTLSDELDLAWRVKLIGYRSVISPHAVLYHKAAVTLRQFKRSQLRFWSERNTIRNLLKNYSTWSLIKVLPRYFVLLIAEMSYYLLIRRTDMFMAIVKAVFWNITHLKTTYTLRRKIQKIRKISDNIIQKDMIKGSIKLGIFGQWLRGDFKL